MWYCNTIYNILYDCISHHEKSWSFKLYQGIMFSREGFPATHFHLNTHPPIHPSLSLPCSKFKMFNNWFNETWNLVYAGVSSNIVEYACPGMRASPHARACGLHRMPAAAPPPLSLSLSLSPWNFWTDRNLQSYSVTLWDKTKVTARSLSDKFRVKADNKPIDGTAQSGHWSKEHHREKSDATEMTSILLFNTSHVKSATRLGPGFLTKLFFCNFSTIPGQLNRFVI